MKRFSLFFTLLILISCLSATEVTVSLSDVIGIGNRNAAEMWGTVYAADPIPYYGPDDEIIAYHLNYSLKGAFPDKETLKTRCDEALTANDRKRASGAGDFGNMVIGAKPYMPVFIQSSQSLSQHYTYGRKLEKAAREAFPEGYSFGKTYYLGYVHVWHQITYKNTNKYINLMPNVKVISEEEFTKLKGEIVLFWTRDTFEEDWQKYLVNRETMNRSTVVIPGEDKMPFYEWSYGCSPTSAAMLLAWWDHYKGMGRLISNHYQRYDSVVPDTDYHVPTIQHQMAQAMDTGDEGESYRWDFCDAYVEVVSNNGYRCASDGLWATHHTTTTLFNEIKRQINSNVPCHVSISGHSIIGVGYNPSPALVYIHDPNHATMMQITKSMLEGYYYVHVYDDSGNHGIFMEITSPNGGTDWGSNGAGETLYSGSVHEITWHSPHGNTWVSLEYSLDGGGNWVYLETETDNDGSYCWLVPDLNTAVYPDGYTNKARIRIKLYDHNDVLIAADGSYGDFDIRPNGEFEEISPNVSERVGDTPYFQKLNPQQAAWGVISVSKEEEDDENQWSVELFDDDYPADFENSVAISEAPVRNNYIVIDNRTLEDNIYGLKINQSNAEAQDEIAIMKFSNVNQSLVLGTNFLTWSGVDIAKVWDAWLEPGNYYFQMDVTEEVADLDFALFQSGGTGLFGRMDALASSAHISAGGRESFQYTISTAGYYGICVSSQWDNPTEFTLLVSDSSVWLGNVSGNWYTAANWQPPFVPGPNHAVVISSGCNYYPAITASLAPEYTQVKSLLIKVGAMLTVEARIFEVVEDMQVFGTLKLMNSSTVFLVSGNITWENHSTLFMGNNDATLLCYRDWTTKSGTYFSGPYRGQIKFISSFDSYLNINTTDLRFPNLSLEKSDGASVIFGVMSNADMVVEGNFHIGANSVFRSESFKSIILKGTFTNLGSFQFEMGAVKLLSQYVNLTCPVGSYFHDLEINTISSTTLNSDIHIKGDFILNSGGFITNSHTMYVGGNWKNNLGTNGFNEASSTVIFNGDGLSLCFGEDFANLKIDSPDCQLSFVEGVSTIDHYTWQAGALSMGGGTLTINDMPTSGINGTYYIASGIINIYQDTFQPVDLVGTYQITGGTMNIYGGLSPSVWTNGGDLSLLMRGGVLDFKDVGINISASFGTQMNIDITSGVIRTTGDFICTRTTFNPIGGSVELYGSTPASVSITPPSTIPNLIINKDGRSADLGQDTKAAALSRSTEPNRNTDITLLTDLNISGDLIIPTGTFNLCGKMVTVGNDLEIYGKLKMISANDYLRVHGTVYWHEGSSSEITRGLIECYSDWYFLGGTANLSGTNLIVFMGNNPSDIHIDGNQSFANVVFAKTSPTYLQNLVSLDTDMNITGNLTINERSKLVQTASDMIVGGTLSHQASTDLYVPDGNSITCNDLVLDGHLMVDGGTFTVLDDLTQEVGSQLSVEAGLFILDAPYTGNHITISGYVVVNGGTFQITNEGIQFGASSNFLLSGGNLKLGWGLSAPISGTFMQTTGTIEFTGTRSADIDLAAGNYLHNVTLSKTGTGTLMLGSDTTLNNLTIISGTMLVNHKTLQVNGNVNIVGGALNAAFFEDLVNVHGDWTNSRGSLGFIEGSGAVAFVGNQRSTINSNETFSVLQINKPLGLAYPLVLGVGASVTADSYEFITGVMVMYDGSTLNTPADGFTLPMGSGLRCIAGTSTINLYGNFVDYNMVIDSNNGFYSGGSIVNVLGTGNRQIVSYIMKFHDLNINLSGGNCHINNYSPEFTGDVHLISGTLSGESFSSYTFHKSLGTNAGTSLTLQSCYLSFVGSENAQLSIGGAADYQSLTINKEIGSSVSLGNSLTMPALSMLNVQQGILQLASLVLSAGGDVNINSGGEVLVNANAQLLMPGTMLNVNSGGKLTALGTSSQPALISRSGEYYYSLNVYSGASIAAEYAIFEYLDYYGVNIYSGATVIPESSFNNCTFRNGSYGGRLLNIDNDQHLSITGAVFPQNTWFGMSNVSKNENSGSLRFSGESGAFSGPSFESDLFQRINWNYQIPYIAANPGTLSFGDIYIPMSGFSYLTITNSGSGTLAGSLLLPDDFTAYIYRNDPRVDGSKRDEPQRTSTTEFMVLPGSSIQVQVVFMPTEPKAYNSTLVITHNAGGAPINISLTGYGMGAQITVNPTQIVKGILPNGSHTEPLSITDSGNTALSYNATIEYPTRSRDVIMAESFETGFPPTGWSTSVVQQVSTAGVWNRSTGTVHPQNNNPQDGSYLAYFNSYNCLDGNQTRLRTGILNFTGYSNINLSFWMFHDSGYATDYDRIQVQMIRVQEDWENVGEPIIRNNSPYGWQQHTINLSAYANEHNLYLGFLGISEYGNDIHIDNIVITGSNPPTGWVSFYGETTTIFNVLSPGASDVPIIEIYTEGMDNGVYQAEIHITSNDPITPVKIVPIEISVGSPGISISPVVVDFGVQQTGTTANQNFNIEATGSLHLSGTITAPAGYSIQAATRAEVVSSLKESNPNRWSSSVAYTLSPGELETYTVKFSPTAIQAYNGNISITSDHLATQTIALSGSGASVPTVQTLAATSITSSSAILNAQIISTGGLISWRGFKYGTDPDPINNGNDYFVSGSNNTYDASPIGFEAGQQIYYCAFAYNELGWSYGDVLSFVTLNPQLIVTPASPIDFGSVIINTTSAAQSFTVSGSDLSGNVGLNASAGFRISLNSGRRSERATTDQITLYPVAGVLAETTIYVFFEPTQAQPYSGTVSIVTLDVPELEVALSGTGIAIPTLTAIEVVDITQSSATSGGNITDDGGSAITARGVCISELPDPTLADEHTSDGEGSGIYASYLTDLLPGTQYYVSAYATNLAGTVYSESVTFITLSIPLVSASPMVLESFGSIIVGENSAIKSFLVAGSGLSTNLIVTAPTGFQIALSESGKQRDYSSEVSIAPSSGSVFETILVRFAPASGGVFADSILVSSTGAETEAVMVSGIGITKPVLTTKPITDISSGSAGSGGIVSSDGFSEITICGICWGQSPEPTTADDFYTLKLPVALDYNLLMENLLPNTTYFVRAFAINAAGTAYGNELSFSTPMLALTAPTNLSITILAGASVLNWDVVPGAVSYKIYRSLSPYVADWGAPIATTANRTRTDAIITEKSFYKVTASTDVARDYFK
ncbi:MAG: choice-of-anchor D domain-containing protein [Candidatus Cloacimonetes bacterium]|nr:choice-of-anchor D domain-containing protein [Candidatus Cloacimonadota bacterium]